MPFPMPLQVQVLWHEQDSETCLPIAETLYKALNRDPFEPEIPGIGIPVLFRTIGGGATPDPALLEDAQCELRIALLTARLVLDEACVGILADQRAAVEAARDRASMVEIALSPGLLMGAALGIAVGPEEDPGERVLKIAILQASRLLAGRTRPDDSARGAAPVKLFLSHTKRDGHGETIASALKTRLEAVAAERFFDRVSIQPGDDIAGELEANIADAALVAIRTDRYISSPWCRREVDLAKRHRRPVVVLDALIGAEPRSSSLLSNLPTHRLDPASLGTADLRPVTNFVGLEVLRFLHAERQLSMLEAQGLLPKGTVLLVRAPEARDLARHLRERREAGLPTERTVFLYPDPVLGAEEVEGLETEGVTFVTPSGRWGRSP